MKRTIKRELMRTYGENVYRELPGRAYEIYGKNIGELMKSSFIEHM